MPLYDEYRDQLKSDIADMVNTGGRQGGAITAALFLKEFTGGLPWAHMDIAGTAWVEDVRPYIPKGAGRHRHPHAGRTRLHQRLLAGKINLRRELLEQTNDWLRLLAKLEFIGGLQELRPSDCVCAASSSVWRRD